MSIAKPTIAIIGAGNMGSALMSGLIAKKHPPEKIWACGPSLEKLQPLKNRFGVLISTDNLKAVEQAEVVILAVKPQYFSVVAKELAPIVQKTKPLIISIMTGISLNSLEQGLGKKLDLVRCMPNTPVLVGCGASALYAAAHTSPEKRLLAETIWGSVGITVWLDDEKQMAAVTALSGSGPAYFFLMLEALQEAGKKLGLSAEVSRLLSLQTAYGAARLALESAEDAASLRQRVTSKGGTTEAALRVFEQGDFRGIIEQALLAAVKRSEELAQGK